MEIEKEVALLKKDYKNLEKKVDKIEKQGEYNIKIINQHQTNLSSIVSELKHITQMLSIITDNWKEATEKNEKMREEQHILIYKRIDKLEKNDAEIKKLLDERTIIKDSNNYQKYVFEIVKYVVLAVLAFVVGKWLS